MLQNYNKKNIKIEMIEGIIITKQLEERSFQISTIVENVAGPLVTLETFLEIPTNKKNVSEPL